MIIFFAIFSLSFISNINSLNENCFHNTCFNLSSSKSNYSQASDACRKLNMTLAFVSDKIAQSLLTNYINSTSESYYIGLKYVHNERFIWDCHSNMVPQLHWSPVPSAFPDETCVYLMNGSMNIGPCHDLRNFICSNDSHLDQHRDPYDNGVGHCPAGFFRYLSKCYRMNLRCNDETKTWEDAQAMCRSQAVNGSLVIVDSMIEQEFLTALMTRSPQALWSGLIHSNINSKLSIWTNGNNTRMPRYRINFKPNEPNNILKEKCLMVYHRLSDIGQINDENCNKFMNYLCESPLLEGNIDNGKLGVSNPLFYQGNCDIGYYEFNETCYQVNEKPDSHEAANEYCKGKLLFVYGYIDIAFIRSLMAYRNVSEVWLSVFDNQTGVNEHQHGANWLLKETIGNVKTPLNETGCYLISSKVKGLQSANQCKDKKSSICYYFLPGHEKNTDHLKCPDNWTKVGKKCFQVKTNHYKFAKSADQCKIYNGKLATLTNMKEVQAINATLNLDSWIGLNGESFLKDTWVDGTKLDYCLFRHTKDMNKEVNKNIKNSCFILRTQKAEWDIRECQKENIFTCEQPAIENACPGKFNINIDGDCYGEFNLNKTWDDAEEICQRTGGNRSHLASFHTWEQEALVFRKLSNMNPYWIGLRIYDETKRWIDESPLNYQQIYHTSALIYVSGMSCFSSKKFKEKDSIWWSRENCGLRRQFVCKISKNRKIISPSAKPNIYSSYYCPKGFIKHDNACFKLLKVSSSWDGADSKCKALFNKSSPIARLASFDSIPQFESVLSSLHKSNVTKVWIGLHHDPKTRQLVWLDERPFNIMKSVTNYDDPFRFQDRIAMEVSTNPFRNGRWWTVHNSNSLPFICRVDPHEIFNPLEDNEFVKSYTALSHQDCPSALWVEYNGFCYYCNHQKLEFASANDQCNKIGAHLLVINDTFEEHFVRSLLAKTKQFPNFVWIGLNVKTPNLVMNWTTIDKSNVFYTHWVQLDNYKDRFTYSDENPQHKTAGCYFLQFNDTIAVDNGMAQSSCDIYLASICKTPIRHKVNPPLAKCAKSINGSMYSLDVQRTRGNAPCVRWDLVNQKDPYSYHLKFQLYSSYPFNKDGYMSYSLQRCSEFINDTVYHGYSCYILKENKYILEECRMVPCYSDGSVDHYSRKELLDNSHPFVVMISVFLALFVVGFLLFAYRKNLLSNYRVRGFLASVLARYQPDCLRYPSGGRPPVVSVSGTGFINPVYTPLEARY